MSILGYLADPHPVAVPTDEGEGTPATLGNSIGDGPPPHMQIDYIRLNQKVTEAKDISGKVENLFIEEREERRQAITEIWGKLREMQKELRDVRQHAATTSSYPKREHVAQAMPQMVPANSEAIMRESVELTRLEKEFATWKAQQQQSVQDLWTHVKSAPSNAKSSAPMEPVGAAGSMKKIREDVDRLDKMVMELQLNVSMAAIRASRIAMRTSELSSAGKKEAISVLEAKEQAITKQMEASRKERGVTSNLDIESLQYLQQRSPADTLALGDPTQTGITSALHDPTGSGQTHGSGS